MNKLVLKTCLFVSPFKPMNQYYVAMLFIFRRGLKL